MELEYKAVVAMQWDFHRTSGWMVKLLQRRRGGVDGIYHCEIPDKTGVIQNIYIGVYSANTGELHGTCIISVYFWIKLYWCLTYLDIIYF